MLRLRAFALTLFITPFSLADTQSETVIDLLIEGDHIVTMDTDFRIITAGAVAVSNGEILEIGKAKDLRAKYQPGETLAGTNKVVMPGLINGHSHAAMTLLRGIADDLSIYEWLNDYIFPAEVAFANRDFVEVGTRLACWEMIRGGTTTFVDMYYHSDVIASVIEQCGLRAMISATVIDQQSPDAKDAQDSLNNAIRFVETWQGKNERITPIFGPHASYTLSPEQLKATRAAAKKLATPISIHMAESPYEVQYARDNYSMGSVDLFESIDFFSGPTIAAHMVWPSEKEIEVLATRNVGVVYNPTSNMKTAAGIAPIAKMLEAGIAVGIGTDGAASNNDLDMWEEMRLGALLQKVNAMNPEVLPARTVLKMATSLGAKAIGLADSIGSLQPGKRADLIQVDFSDVHHLPTYDVVSHLVYVTDEQDVVTVVVEGKILMRDRVPLTIDRPEVRARANRIAADISRALEIEQSD